MVMVGNGGRQEGSLLKTPFYGDPHDTPNTNVWNTNTNMLVVMYTCMTPSTYAQKVNMQQLATHISKSF